MTSTAGTITPQQHQQLYRRALATVVVSQAFGGAGLAAGISVGALIAQDMLGSAALSGLPTALFTLDAGLTAFLIGRITHRTGRRRALEFGLFVIHEFLGLGADGHGAGCGAGGISQCRPFSSRSTRYDLITESKHRVVCRLDNMLQQRQMTLAELSRRVDISVVNLSILKNNRSRAIRFTTLTALCEALDCTPGDLFAIE